MRDDCSISFIIISCYLWLLAAIDKWELHFQPAVLPDKNLRTSQVEWEEPLFRQAAQQLVNFADGDVARAQILATARPESGLWLNALPSQPLGTHLKNESFRVAVALRIGCSVCHQH